MDSWSDSSSDSDSESVARHTAAEENRSNGSSTSRSTKTSTDDITAKLASTDFLSDNNLEAERITPLGAVCRSTFRPDLKTYGPGWSKKGRYYTSKCGIKHDAHKVPPGKCFNCGGDHWRKDCRWAVHNRRGC